MQEVYVNHTCILHLQVVIDVQQTTNLTELFVLFGHILLAAKCLSVTRDTGAELI